MKTALLVIDMQNDYLWENRKKLFSYDTARLTASVNALVHRYRLVIYIRHIIQNLPTNRLLFGYSIAGTEGAELYGGLDIVSDYCFDKYFGDAFTNRALGKLLREQGVETVHLCGLDECGCVAATALGAVKRGFKTEIIRKGTATMLPATKVAKTHEKLRKADVTWRDDDE